MRFYSIFNTGEKNMKTSCQNIIVRFSQIFIFMLVFGVSVHALANIANPAPPKENPHPPKTEQDKKRVQFAQKVIEEILMKNESYVKECCKDRKDQSFIHLNEINNLDYNYKLSESCLLKKDCVSQKMSASSQDVFIKKNFGLLSEYRHTHIIPWSFENFSQNKKGNQKKEAHLEDTPAKLLPSMPRPKLAKDEYMIHSYVVFLNEKGWYHLNLIVSEDEKGNIEFRRFYLIEMPFKGASFPDGVVCTKRSILKLSFV